MGNLATSAAKSSTTNSYQCVQYFHGSKQWYRCQHLGFLTCAQMLMHVTAHRGRTNTVKRVHPESFRKSLATLGSRTCISTVLGFFVWCLADWATSCPNIPTLSLVEASGFNRQDKVKQTKTITAKTNSACTQTLSVHRKRLIMHASDKHVTSNLPIHLFFLGQTFAYCSWLYIPYDQIGLSSFALAINCT